MLLNQLLFDTQLKTAQLHLLNKITVEGLNKSKGRKHTKQVYLPIAGAFAIVIIIIDLITSLSLRKEPALGEDSRK